MHVWLHNKPKHHRKSSTTTHLQRIPDLLPNTSPQRTQLHQCRLLSANCRQVSRKPVDTLVKLSALPHHSQQLSGVQVGTSATSYPPSAAHSAFGVTNRASTNATRLSARLRMSSLLGQAGTFSCLSDLAVTLFALPAAWHHR